MLSFTFLKIKIFRSLFEGKFLYVWDSVFAQEKLNSKPIWSLQSGTTNNQENDAEDEIHQANHCNLLQLLLCVACATFFFLNCSTKGVKFKTPTVCNCRRETRPGSVAWWISNLVFQTPLPCSCSIFVHPNIYLQPWFIRLIKHLIYLPCRGKTGRRLLENVCFSDGFT